MYKFAPYCRSMEIAKSHSLENETSRKRRRSDLEEAVITIIDTTLPPIKEKKRKLETDVITEDKKSDAKEPRPKIEIAKSEREKEKPKDSSMVQAKSKDSERQLSSSEKGKKVKVISIAKVMKTAKPTDLNVHLLKVKDNVKTPPKQKFKKESEKSGPSDKDKTTPHDDRKSQKRRNSKNNKSLNTSVAENKTIKTTDSVNKEKSKDSKEQNNETEISTTEKSSSVNSRATSLDSPETAKDRIQFDDDTSLAIIARKSSRTSSSALPTISNVRSLSLQNCDASKGNSSQTVETTVEASSDSSIFTPTSTDNVRNMKEAVNKLQKLRNETDPPVGRVGVRAFARMTSPPAPAAAPEVRPNNNSNVQVEIKAEPMDFDDPERHMEKMDLMNAFRLRPVNPTNLRGVRINKVVVTPLARMMTPNQPTKPIEVRPRAKKTFPKPDEGRSELNSKNSMVYIPGQPPMTQAPIRMQRPIANGPTSNASVSRTITTINTSTGNYILYKYC